MSSVITKRSKKRTRDKQIKKLQFRKGIYGLYKKQKRQDWDHKAYHDALSVIYCVVAQ